MRVVTLILLLFFCKVSDFRKIRKNKGNNNGSNSKKLSSTVKRYAPGLQCDTYIYLHEKYLDCQERKLTYILADWPEDLMHMLLARNRIRILKNNAFSRFQKLKSLDLQQNEITKIEELAFSGLKKLTTLLLQHNQIKVLSEEVFIQLPRLSYLRLYDNPWDCNCELETLVTLLQIPRNRNFGNYAKCETPTEMKGQKLKQIRSEIICIDDADSTEPKPLEGPKITRPSADSSLCHIFVFPVPTLDCRKKELHRVPTDITPDIVKLDLSNNKIKQLQAKEFVDIPNLEILNLSGNGIEVIDPAAFSGMMNLRELDLSNNTLYNFQYGVLEDLYFLKRLWLKENPWRCDYHIHYLFYWLKHHYDVNYNGLECRSPDEYKGWFVGRYVRSYYEECPNEKFQASVDRGAIDEEWERHKDHTRQMENAKKKAVLLTVLS
ncbi:leucine-rich repeat-containing protein 17 [Discoglossus pictus]